MVPRYPFDHEDGYRVQRFGCPLLFPTPTGQACDDPHFRAGTGCVAGSNTAPGGLMRATLDRHADPYTASYRQRTSAERINSQATALGIERPKVRNTQSVARLNALTDFLIYARALQRVRSRNATFPRPPAQAQWCSRPSAPERGPDGEVKPSVTPSARVQAGRPTTEARKSRT